MGNEKKAADIKEEHKPPSWLDVSFIQEALHRGGDENLQVKELSVRAATAPGDNYGSVLYRVKATFADTNERSLIVKVPPAHEDTVREFDLFGHEIAMFKNVLPKMQALLEEAAPGRYPPLSPRCLHQGTSPVDFLVLEDLVAQGFTIADRHKGLGLRHSIVGLRTLGRFHAASVAVLERKLSDTNELSSPYDVGNKIMNTFITQAFDGTIAACKSWSGFEELARCLEDFRDIATEKFAELHKAKPTTFNVILHGDFWMNNMMFRYEDAEPVDARALDLQISHVGPAVLDVIYFLSCSLSEDVSRHHQDLLLREYHRALVETMEVLGLQPPSLEALQADVASHGAYFLFGALGVLPLVKAQSAPNMDAVLQGDENASRFLYKDPVVKRWMQRILPEYKAKGWISG